MTAHALLNGGHTSHCGAQRVRVAVQTLNTRFDVNSMAVLERLFRSGVDAHPSDHCPSCEENEYHCNDEKVWIGSDAESGQAEAG